MSMARVTSGRCGRRATGSFITCAYREAAWPTGNEFLPLGLRETAGHFVDEDVRREEVMDRLPEIVAQPNGLGRQRAADHPTYRGRRVEDVLHGSSSSSSSFWNV